MFSNSVVLQNKAFSITNEIKAVTIYREFVWYNIFKAQNCPSPRFFKMRFQKMLVLKDSRKNDSPKTSGTSFLLSLYFTEVVAAVIFSVVLVLFGDDLITSFLVIGTFFILLFLPIVIFLLHRMAEKAWNHFKK